MADSLEKDPQAVMFYLYKTIEGMKKTIDKMETDLVQIKLELAKIEEHRPPSRLKSNAAGGGAGAAITAILIGLWEYFKN